VRERKTCPAEGRRNQKSKNPFSQGFLWFWSPDKERVASCPLFVWGSLRFAFPRPKEGGGLFFLFPKVAAAKKMKAWVFYLSDGCKGMKVF
jgi:hypothetical protein